MPGESPGHQILLLEGDAEGQDIYFAGDLYHHQIEFVDEALNVNWADLKQMRASKAALMTKIADKGGLVYFTHISGSFSVVRQKSGKMEWQETSRNRHA
jgi:glyoxylase-like metal-dependent hydrolase (beta-lactamase superfamily II)